MSEPNQPNPDEIEELLRQAKEAAGADASEGQAPEGDAAEGTPAAESPANAASASSQQAAEKSPGGVATAENEAAKGPTSGKGSPHDDINVLLQNAEQALASIDQPTTADLEGIAPFQFKDFTSEPPSSDKATLELLRDVELDLKIELGRAQMQLEDILKLRKGSVVPLDKLAGDPVDVYVNGRLVARGEVLVLNDSFCVRVAQLLAGEEAA